VETFEMSVASETSVLEETSAERVEGMELYTGDLNHPVK